MEISPNGWKTIDATANVSFKEISVWSDENYNAHHKNQRICAFIFETVACLNHRQNGKF